MRQSELKAILKDHKLWIQSDRKQGKRADLLGANLQGANLQGAVLRSAYLQGANLEGANLYCADLEGANLYCADLQGANLQDASLYCADLRGADLLDAKFTTNFKRVGWFNYATFSEDQIPWVVLHPDYLKWANTIKWVKAKADAA